ncbi:DNA-3-methyladenine glycosylase I [Sulfoacidibacillus thermotolerans]|uniref:Uncharacterized protein n=1 Tax=Sulfoacidibacillus thermotolerans TaxID=1765684 RepID=A0A2U3D8L5_SULT2|nr:DNA-3-methyladenine glycosylase I [Sulfoacidibacillus thermotolerans]PWI57617.1 hypothetical protein BM613_07415 [Sulfoacidibacillus thermotolerans]
MESITFSWVGTDHAFFEILTKVIFYTGFSKGVVNRRWSAFRIAFCGFDIARVAFFDELQIESLLRKDSGIVRNARKVQATVTNARICIELIGQYGSLQNFMAELSRSSPLSMQIVFRKTFSLVGESAALALWRELQEERGTI